MVRINCSVFGGVLHHQRISKTQLAKFFRLWWCSSPPNNKQNAVIPLPRETPNSDGTPAKFGYTQKGVNSELKNLLRSKKTSFFPLIKMKNPFLSIQSVAYPNIVLGFIIRFTDLSLVKYKSLATFFCTLCFIPVIIFD